MKKLAILLAVVFTGVIFSGCFLSSQEITFTTPAYSYLEPGVDTVDFTAKFDTNAYLSKIVCADEETLDTEGPALMSAYAEPSDPDFGTAFNLSTEKLSKFEGNLCDIYVTAWDDSTVEETEAVVRVNIGAEAVVEEEVVEEVELCEDGSVCPAEEEEVVEEEVAEEEVVE